MSDNEEQVVEEQVEVPEPRLKERYREEVVSGMVEQFGYENNMAVPKLQKVVLNIGVGEATEEGDILDEAQEVLREVTGQEPILTTARKSVAGFHLRKGDPIGTKVTLRGARMFEFLDRLISVVLPRIRDFDGLPAKSFDGSGNYSMGIEEHFVFPEVDVDSFEHSFGMDITIVTTADTDGEADGLLRLLGMPLRS